VSLPGRVKTRYARTMWAKHDCAVMLGHEVSHLTSSFCALTTKNSRVHFSQLMPPCMQDHMLPQTYHNKICTSHMRATAHEEPMPAFAVRASQDVNVNVSLRLLFCALLPFVPVPCLESPKNIFAAAAAQHFWSVAERLLKHM
jgi:hypothetical protein